MCFPLIAGVLEKDNSLSQQKLDPARAVISAPCLLAFVQEVMLPR